MMAESPRPIDGHERIVWEQVVDRPVQINQYTYVAYIDGTRFLLSDATCKVVRTWPVARLECSASLPPMPAGAHRLELAAISNAESARSPAMDVFAIGPIAAR